MHCLSCFTNSSEHSSENKFMEGDDRVPVKESCKSTWTEACGHNESCDWWFPFRFDRFNLKIKLCFTRQLHFCSEREGAVSVDANDPPEIECLTKLNCFWEPSAPAKTRASDKRVHPPSDAPENVSRIPPVASTNAADCRI